MAATNPRIASPESQRNDLRQGLEALAVDYDKIVSQLDDVAIGSVAMGHLAAELGRLKARGVALEALAGRFRRQLQLAQR